MSLIEMEVYCKECGFSYVDEKDIPADQEVLKVNCQCGKVMIFHRCQASGYSKMKVREVHAHEIEDRKKLKPRTRTHAKTTTRKVE